MNLARILEDQFDDQTYPTTTSQLIEDHGDLEMRLPNGAVTLGEVLGRLPEETLESPDEARLAAYGALGEGAIGRKAYSDRDPTSLGEAGPEPLSL
jgi:hypothetical protein